MTPDQSQRYAIFAAARQAEHLAPASFTTRSTFVTDPDEMPIFDRVFAQVFDPTAVHPGGHDAEAVTFAAAGAA